MAFIFYRKTVKTLSQMDILTAMNPNEAYLVTSRSARILHASPAFISMFGSDPTGRNLNDMMDDEDVAEIIINASTQDVYMRDCDIGECFCSCGVRLSAPDRMTLVFRLLEDRRDHGVHLDLIRYTTGKISGHLANLSAALFLPSVSEALPAEHKARCRHAIFDLFRVYHNVNTKADFSDQGIINRPKPGNLLEDLEAVCRQAAEKGAPYFDLYVEADSDPDLLAAYDTTLVQRAILNLIEHAARHSTLPRPRMAVRISREDGQVVFQLRSEGNPRTPYQPPLGRGGMPIYGDDMEMEIATILLRAVKSSIISAPSKDGSWLCRASIPIVPVHPGQSFSSMNIDWYGGYNIVDVELSGILPWEAYLN